MSRSLDAINRRLNREASDVTFAAESIAATAEDISGAATEQASSLQETAASMNEITVMVANNAANSKKSREVAHESRNVTTEGKAVMDSLLAAIHEIDRSNDSIMKKGAQSNRNISEIVTIIETIRDRTKVINDIVFQTKLLSFNASVEAVRAGDQGKGFAVVAEEVGKLAQVSGDAAREIGALLTESVDKVKATVTASQARVGIHIKTGSDKIGIGMTIANRGNKVVRNIVANVATMEAHIAEIANATEEQAKGVSEVNTAINQLEYVTQANSGAAEASALSAKALNAQAHTIFTIAIELNAIITGRLSNETSYGPEAFHQERISLLNRALPALKVITPDTFDSSEQFIPEPIAVESEFTSPASPQPRKGIAQNQTKRH